MKNLFNILFIILTWNTSATVYYVSTDGNDQNNGQSLSEAFRTISKLLNEIQAGDTAYIRGGLYILNQTTQRSGTQDHPIIIKSYNHEQVILEGSGNSSNGGRFRIRHDWYVIEQLELRNGSAGFTLTRNASNNIINNCRVHDCYYTGFYLANGASNNLIINCDAYNMYDSGTNGQHADGFGVNGQNSMPGPGNKFENCRAYNNSDDGFDVWKAGHPVEFIRCLSYRNGHHDGDGNGFKLGINSTQNDKHILKYCMAWDNKQNGFDYNDNELSQTLYHCTSYHNGRNYKFWNINGNPATHDIQNCISAVCTHNDILLQTIITENTNSWNLVDPNDADIVNDNFLSVDDQIITGPRNTDGSIPDSDFLKLKSTSIFIDAGVDVGLPYNGSAPDLGAFETGTMSLDEISDRSVFYLYPNPASDHIHLIYHIGYPARLRIYDFSGKCLKNMKLLPEYNKETILLGNLKKGYYFLLVYENGMAVFRRKFIIQ